MKLSVALTTAVMLSACSAANEEAKLCQTNIKQQLINPETAQFFEFSPIDREAFRAGVSNAIYRKASGANGEPIRYGAKWEAIVNQAMESTEGAKLYSYRVKAASKIGLTVTNTEVCAVLSEDACSCINADKD